MDRVLIVLVRREVEGVVMLGGGGGGELKTLTYACYSCGYTIVNIPVQSQRPEAL